MVSLGRIGLPAVDPCVPSGSLNQMPWEPKQWSSVPSADEIDVGKALMFFVR
jgi:hypothetical protein